MAQIQLLTVLTAGACGLLPRDPACAYCAVQWLRCARCWPPLDFEAETLVQSLALFTACVLLRLTLGVRSGRH